MNMFVNNTEAIYQTIGESGLGTFRPFFENGKTYVINAEGKKVEAEFRNNAILPIESWKKLDTDIASVIRTNLTVFSDIEGVGTVDLGGMDQALGTMLYINQMRSDSMSAELSMSGRGKISNDTPLFKDEALPLPMINSDFRVDIRTLRASSRGAFGMGSNVAIDTSNSENAARRTAEKLEDLAIIGGGTFSYAGHSIYGITTAPNRSTTTFAKKWDDATKTGAERAADVRAWIQIQFLNGIGDDKSMILYLPKEYHAGLSEPYSAAWDAKSVRTVLMDMFPELIDIKTAFRMPTDNICLLEMRPRTVKVVRGFDSTPITWISGDTLEHNWKLLTLKLPKFYSDYNDVMGLVHATYA